VLASVVVSSAYNWMWLVLSAQLDMSWPAAA